MTPPRSFAFLAIVFAVVYAVAYAVAVWKNYALFTYHPVPGTIGMGVEKAQDGPAMYWYGWMATATIAALGACLIACLVPERLAKRVWSGWSWVVPLGVLLFFAYLLRGYFLR
jgi:hypothetical protein